MMMIRVVLWCLSTTTKEKKKKNMNMNAVTA